MFDNPEVEKLHEQIIILTYINWPGDSWVPVAVVPLGTFFLPTHHPLPQDALNWYHANFGADAQKCEGTTPGDKESPRLNVYFVEHSLPVISQIA